MRTKNITSFLLIISFIFTISYCIVDRTYFNYLGLKITANPQQIENAYQQKKLKIQSIENQQQKQKKIKLLQTAYINLINQKQRQKYQRYGKDVFKNIKQITSKNPYTSSDSRKSPSMNIKIPVSIEDLYNGTTVKALFQTKEACSKCMGTGAQSPKNIKTCNSCGGKGFQVIDGRNRYGQPQKFQGLCPHCHGFGKKNDKQCSTCHGKRIVQKLKEVQIKIPSKFQGNQLRLRNYGPEQDIGAPSDFIVTIQEISSNNWKRIGDNLHYTLQISLQQSIFGFQKTINHLSGEQITIQRNELTFKQTKMSFAQKGWTSKGKLNIEFKIVTPTFTDKQLHMLQDFFNKYKL